MCPACIATTAMLIASAVSAGGVTAVLANKLFAKKVSLETYLEINEPRRSSCLRVREFLACDGAAPAPLEWPRKNIVKENWS